VSVLAFWTLKSDRSESSYCCRLSKMLKYINYDFSCFSGRRAELVVSERAISMPSAGVVPKERCTVLLRQLTRNPEAVLHQ